MYAINSQYRDEYFETIYSGKAKNKLKIILGYGTDDEEELENVDQYCEGMTLTKRILPEDGTSRFSLSNFIAKELTITLHNVDKETFIDPIQISMGTYLESKQDYEYVPLGIFYVSEQPTTDKDKTTFKLRDGAIKFDFNYDGSLIMRKRYVITEDTNYQPQKEYYVLDDEEEYVKLEEGTDYNVGDLITGEVYEAIEYTTKGEILEDICQKAGINSNIETFYGDTDVVGIYDNSISARQYVAFLAEQSGQITTIDRENNLIFINLKNLTTFDLDVYYLESFEKSEQLSIKKVIYEDGIVKYESGTSTSPNEILYIDASNPYIESQAKVDGILNKVINFTIDGYTTGKVIGNPCLDAYDLIRVYDGDDTIATFLSNTTLDYKIRMLDSFNSPLRLSDISSNVTLIGELSVRKYARTLVDNVEGKIAIIAGITEGFDDRISKIEVTNSEITQQVKEKVATDEFNKYVTENTAALKLTSDYIDAEVSKIITGANSIQKIETAGVKLDQNGVTVYREGTPTETIIDDKGLSVISDGEALLKAKIENGDSIIESKYLKVNEYLVIGTRSRIEDYDEDGGEYTGVFWIGD